MTARAARLAARPRVIVPEYAAVATVGAAVLALLILPTAFAPLGPVDDHEIIRMSRGEILPLFEATRFRPLYWLVRNAEGLAWGANPIGWGFDRALLGLATILLGYLIARRYAPLIVALPAALLVVVGPQAEAFYRFGPQEAYGMPILLGSALALLSGLPVVGLALAVAAALTKETFVIAAVPLLAFAWWRGYRSQVMVAGLVILVAAAGVALAALHGGTSTGGSRYLLPWIVVPIGVGVWLGRRRPVPVAMVMLALVAVGLGWGIGEAGLWAEQGRAFQAQLAIIRAEQRPGEPLIVNATVNDYERALSLRIWIPDGVAMLAVEPCSGVLCDRLQQVSREGGYGYVPLAGQSPMPLR